MRTEHEGAIVVAVDVGARHDLPAGGLPDTGIVSGWPRLWNMVLPWRRRHEPVNILRVLTRLTELGAMTDDDVADVMIRPEVRDLPVLDFNRFDTIVARGYETGRAALEPWVAEWAAASPSGTIVW
jgi:predicted acylesterase/phospholipase RssA